MVMEMMMFIRVVWIGDWDFYLEVLQLFVKYFFVYDMLNYVCMVFVYLVEMKIVKEIDLEIYQEFQNGNWVVNKNLKVVFCVVGVDYVFEYVNRLMKVLGGLIGIMLNFIVCMKYFFIVFELVRLVE